MASATSAVREAVNGEQVLAQIREQTGAQINVMTGQDEARLATSSRPARWFQLRNRDRLLVINIGGGSLEVASGIDEEPDVVASLPLGAGAPRCGTGFSTDPPSPQEVRRLRKHAASRVPRRHRGMLRPGSPMAWWGRRRRPAAGQDRGHGPVR